jgi:ABC-type uncharacterized transport system involved in gliding motility auxiliary subunit
VTRPRTLLALQLGAVLAIVACALVLADRMPLRLDLTPEKRFSLSAHTRDVLARLDRPTEITYFFSSQDAVIRRSAAGLLALYGDASPLVSVRLLDLDRNPGLATQLGVTSYNVAVVDADDVRLRLDLVNEEILTAALLRVIDRELVPVYVVQGHGERPIDGDERRGLGQALAALTHEGFAPHPLAGVAEIPADAKVVLLAGPTRDLAAREVDALDAWVRAGGALLALIDAPTPAGIARLLGGFGIVPGDDLIVDVQSRLVGADGLSARVAYVNQRLIPTTFEAAALLPVAQTVRLEDTPAVDADYLAVTAESAWANVDRSVAPGALQARPGPEDRAGPLPVAAYATVAGTADTPGRIVFVGDADFVTDVHLDVLGNRELFLALAGLAAARPATLAERPTSHPPSPLSAFVLTAIEGRLLLAAGSIVPGLLLVAAAFVANRRRRA